jgi:FdhD protein
MPDQTAEQASGSKSAKKSRSIMSVQTLRFGKSSDMPLSDIPLSEIPLDEAHFEDWLSVEAPLEIYLREPAKTIAVTMRTPGNDEDLALGFLYSEGVISSIDQVLQVESLGQDAIAVSLKDPDKVNLDALSLERHSYVSSSCGVCGKKSIDTAKTQSLVQPLSKKVTAELLYELPKTLQAQQPDFGSTGGIHASALFDLDGRLLTVREDVGRHNALDKLIGDRLKQDLLPLEDTILLLSGRASFELLQKAAKAGIAMVASVGAPSSLAYETARACNITLVGFLRQSRFNVYCGDGLAPQAKTNAASDNRTE